jgi:predicted Zn-dependent protease
VIKFILKYLPGIFSVIILFNSQITFGQSEISSLVKKGLENCYNFQWTSAENIFLNLQKKYPDNPAGYHYQSEIYLWYYLGTKNNEDLKSFTHYSDLAIQKCENELDKNSDNSEILYLLGMNYTFRAIAFTKAESYLDAAWAAKKSESNLSECLELNDKKYDAYLGLGLYNFAVAQIPKAFSWVLSIAGFSGDEETGFRYLKLASEKGDIARVEAKYFYSQLLSEVITDYKTADFYLKDLSKKYPANLLFNYSLASNLIKQKRLTDAKNILQKILSSNDKKFIQLISFSNFLMGDVYFKQNDFPKAINYYNNFLSATPDKDYTGIANYRAAICLEFIDKHNDALQKFNKSGQGNMDIDDDIYAKRRGKILSGRKIFDEELTLIKLSNLIEQGNFKTAVDSIKSFLQNVNNENLKSESYFYLADAEFQLGNYNEAVSSANQSLKLNCGDEKWIHPFAAYTAARSLNKLGKLDEAKKFIEKAEDFSDYDYKNKLENLLKVLHRETNN